MAFDGKTCSASPASSGVPQGTVLGILLFLIYINNLPYKVGSTVCLFDDDHLLYRTLNSEDATALQEDLNPFKPSVP